ncbi:galactose-3-O-sulfotransferase 3-like [Saccoglossus kowalevskii]|uniref:Galactose-3-O-sulfotransferase 3-like n=1 Tax=Saccoglossus kowalevskii TaxID=10224 RepID=A0ABM0GYY2_SACKO|nr:PREDICTED: galactose-3-O-sulfotransferase 3-like [Saccoglossus kowalevskii]
MPHMSYNTHINSTTECKPVSKFIFIKTMKTGSSTTTTMLVRYGLRNKLKIARDHEDIECTNCSTIDYSVTHRRYIRSSLDNLVTNAKYFTILRSPYSQLLSAFHWFNFTQFIGNISFEKFIEHPERFQNSTEVHHQHKNGQLWYLEPNFNMNQLDDDTYIQQTFKQLEAEMDLVMITEYYDESLILLKKMLCWKFDDLIYHKKKVHSPKEELSDSMKTSIRKWNKADFLLYAYFNRTFWEKVNNYDGDFHKDLREFRNKQQKVTSKCKAQRNNLLCRRLFLDSWPIYKLALKERWVQQNNSKGGPN